MLAKLLLLLTVSALPLAAQAAEAAYATTNARLEQSLTPLKEAAERGDAHATRQIYLRYGLEGHTDQARAWSARYNDMLTRQAEAGDTHAMLLLGARYLSGRDYTPQDIAAAVTWFSRASEAGEAAAAYILGDVFSKQGNIPMSQQAFERAFSLYTKRAEAGPDAEALYWLGFMQQNGIGAARDVEAGIAKLQQAADMGSPWATAQLFKSYYSGIGVARDTAKAISYACRAADEHHDGAMAYVVATAYLTGKDVARDETRGEQYLDQAVKANIPDAIYMKANRLENSGRLAEALPYYRQSASMQQREAMVRLGALLLHGAQGVDKEEERGLALLNSAASRYDSPQAAWELACYYTSVGEPELADPWYAVAADRGIAEAMARRGMLHLIPTSELTWNPTEAYRWWRIGKQAGDPTCTLYVNLFHYLFIPLLLLLVFGVPAYIGYKARRAGRKQA